MICFGASAAELPDEIAAKGETVVLEVHAIGAQIYECKADPNGKLSWQFREPIATLIRDGKTIGRHYAGPSWEIEGSVVVGKVVARTPGKDDDDIPWLKLEVTEKRGDGPLKDVTTIQRINTDGGTAEKECKESGEFQIEGYGADYVFLKKP
jgi:hypothetical protein